MFVTSPRAARTLWYASRSSSVAGRLGNCRDPGHWARAPSRLWFQSLNLRLWERVPIDGALPAVGEVQDGPCRVHVGKGRERVHQDGALLHVRSRLPKDLAKPERDEQVARRGGFLEHLADDADQYRRHAVPLDLPCDQSAGPMARRSPRGQDDVIDAVLLQKARDRGSGLRDEAPLLAIQNVTHRADV